MTEKNLVPFLKRRIVWVLPIALASVAVGGAIGKLWLQQKPPAPISAAPVASPTLAPSPSVLPSIQPSIALSPSPSPTQSPSASPSAAVDPNALTAQERALNQAAKQRIASSGANSVDTMVEMRVAIAEGVPALSLTITQGAALLDAQSGSTIEELSGTYSVQPSGDGMAIDGKSLPYAVKVEPKPGGSITLGDRTYRGRLLIVNDSGRLWAVNLINLRQYLHSVVASEVSPDWEGDALKAQAIAARSYALTYHFKPMSSLFDLGATEYYQVYSGIAREASTTNQAVDATAGEYVSYKGGVVESLYAASEDIVAEAFQGQGMSQLGALSLAEQGFTYQQILNKYYPGTKVGRFQQDF
jgi:stage II sporulation protein D